jgi:ubiquinone/menaquinone biosynthesis C-methylase UbiE
MDLAERWNQSHAEIPKDRSVSRYATEREEKFPDNSLVLDLGGGTGADALFFLKKGHRVILVDISNYALKLASEKASGSGFSLDTRRADIGEGPIPLGDDSIDIVYSRLTLHYFNRQQTVNIIREVMRVMKVGGKAFITIKSPKDDKEMAFLKRTAEEMEDGVFKDRGEIKSRFTREQWEQNLQEAGVLNSTVTEYEEDLSGRTDEVKSGSKKFLLNEIQFTKD